MLNVKIRDGQLLVNIVRLGKRFSIIALLKFFLFFFWQLSWFLFYTFGPKPVKFKTFEVFLKKAGPPYQNTDAPKSSHYTFFLIVTFHPFKRQNIECFSARMTFTFRKMTQHNLHIIPFPFCNGSPHLNVRLKTI